MSTVGPEPVLTPEQHKELMRWRSPVIAGEVAGPIAVSAPASQPIAPEAQGDPNALPTPPGATTEGARPLPRRDRGGRYAPRAVFPCCEACGWTLAERLDGATYCPAPKCGAYRKPVGMVPGVDAGTVTAEVLAVGT